MGRRWVCEYAALPWIWNEYIKQIMVIIFFESYFRSGDWDPVWQLSLEFRRMHSYLSASKIISMDGRDLLFYICNAMAVGGQVTEGPRALTAMILI